MLAKKKFLKKSAKNGIEKIIVKRSFLQSSLKKKIIGLIIYNINNFFYSITILKTYRNKGVGTNALIKFIATLKVKKLKLITMVKKSNENSVHLHKKLSKSYRTKNKNFFYFKLL